MRIDLLFLSRLSSFLIKSNIRIITILDLELTTIINVIDIKYIFFDYLRVLRKKKIFSKSLKETRNLNVLSKRFKIRLILYI